jgi:hypothetical protein
MLGREDHHAAHLTRTRNPDELPGWIAAALEPNNA